MKKLVLVLTMAMAAATAWADLAVVAPSRPGGLLNVIFNGIGPTFEKENLKMSATYTGNCKLGGVREWVETKDKKLLFSAVNAIMLNGCMHPVTENNFVGIAFFTDYAVCSKKSQPGNTLAKFMDPTQKKTFAVAEWAVKRMKSLAEFNKDENLKIIPYQNSKAVYTAFLANDIDYTFADAGWALKNQSTVNCLFYTGVVQHNQGDKLLKDVMPKFPGKEIYDAFIVVGNNLDSNEMSKVRTTFHKAIKSDLYTSTVMTKGRVAGEKVTASPVKYIENMVKAGEQ